MEACTRLGTNNGLSESIVRDTRKERMDEIKGREGDGGGQEEEGRPDGWVF